MSQFSIKMTPARPTGLPALANPHHLQRVMDNPSWCQTFSHLSGVACVIIHDEKLDLFESVFNSLRIAYLSYWLFSCYRNFKPGINHDGYFTSENLLQQVEHAIDIFEGKTKGTHRDFFSLTMPHHTRKELVMPYHQERCWKLLKVSLWIELHWTAQKPPSPPVN